MQEPDRKAHTSIEDATKGTTDRLAKDHPEWVDANGECSSCVSMSHELADPTHIPDELLDEASEKKAQN